jgi:hypothetical protein
MKFKTLKFKIIFLYTSLVAVILILYSSILFTTLKHTLFDSVEKTLRLKSKEIIRTANLLLDSLRDNPRALEITRRVLIGDENEPYFHKDIEMIEEHWHDRKEEMDIDKDYIVFTEPDGKSLVFSKKYLMVWKN